MPTLRMGYDVFAGSTQAGYDDSLPGNIQLETAKGLPYKLRVQRLSNGNYWNETTQAWVASAPAEADEMDFQGSRPQMSAVSTVRRLSMKLPTLVLDGIDSAGCTVTAYAEGDNPATQGEFVILTFKPVT